MTPSPRTNNIGIERVFCRSNSSKVSSSISTCVTVSSTSPKMKVSVFIRLEVTKYQESYSDVDQRHVIGQIIHVRFLI